MARHEVLMITVKAEKKCGKGREEEGKGGKRRSPGTSISINWPGFSTYRVSCLTTIFDSLDKWK